MDNRRHPARKAAEDFNVTRAGPSSSPYRSMPNTLSLPKSHHHCNSMYNPVEDSDKVKQHQATLEKLEALRVASELEAFRHRQTLEFPETTLTRYDYCNPHHLHHSQQQQHQQMVLRHEEPDLRYGSLVQHHKQEQLHEHQQLVQQQQQPDNLLRENLQQQQQQQQQHKGSRGENPDRQAEDEIEKSHSNQNEVIGLSSKESISTAEILTRGGKNQNSTSFSLLAPKRSTGESSENEKETNDRGEWRLEQNSKLCQDQEVWHVEEDDSIKPEVKSDIESQDGVKTQSRLLASIDRLDPMMLWNMIKSKMLGNFTLLNLLLEKLSFHEKQKMRKSSPKEKLKFFLQQIVDFLEEVSLLWNACCDSLESLNSEDVSMAEVITLTSPMTKFLVEDSSHFRVKAINEINTKFRHIFIQSEEQAPTSDMKTRKTEASKPVKMQLDVKVENVEYFANSDVIDSDVDGVLESDDCDGQVMTCREIENSDASEDGAQIENSVRKTSSKTSYPSVSIPRRGDKEQKKLKEQKNKQTKVVKEHDIDLSKRKIRKDKIPGPPYVCPGCHASYSQRKTLRIHVKSGKCHGIPRPERPKHKVIKGRYFCLHPVCVPSGRDLGDQVTSYTCAEQVWQHFADKHMADQVAVVICELCSKKFPSEALVELHYKLSHEPKFTCKYCGQPCMSKQKLQNHERRHTGEKPFECEHCDFKTNFKNSLNTHKARIHDKNLIKKHMCELCGKSFFTKTCLREHIVTHTDAKRYSCEICGKLLRNDSSYRRHMMCVHSVKQTCELCGKDIYTKTGLERHKKEVHGIMP